MGDTVEPVKSTRQRRGCVGRAGPAAARRVSPEAFLLGVSTAWAHLQPEERKAIRAACRNGRQLHDRLTVDPRITLGRDPGPREQQHQPSPTELRSSLGALVRRGARLQSLTVWFRDAKDSQREAQLLAALEACSECPLQLLELQGAVPLSGAVAEAVAACCPHLSNLVLDHQRLSRPSDAVPARGAVAEYDYGCGQLLTLCGPRLRGLTLLGVHHWKALSYMALRRCTALTSLALDAGGIQFETGRCERFLASPAMEANVFSAVAHLTTLESLSLLTNSAPTAPEAVRTHATCVACLSTLTALTHLQLQPSWSYDHHGNSWSIMQRDGDRHGAWHRVRAAHRAALLSALCCMPRLQDLCCPTLWLQPSELAPLTALTSVNLRGLLSPAVGRPQEQQDPGRAGAPGASVALPPNLQELVLGVGVSPRAFALLRPSPAFSRLYAQGLTFGMSDVMEDGQLRPETVEAVGPAVRLLTTYRDPTAESSSFFIDGDCGPSLLQPRAGHMEWIRQLRGLAAFRSVGLYNMALRAGDLSCLGNTLCNLTDLALRNCPLPAVALPLLRNPMLELRTLEVDVSACEGIANSTLEPLLLALLCRPPTGAAPLEGLAITRCPNTINAVQCVRSVTEQLEADFGVSGVALSVQ